MIKIDKNIPIPESHVKYPFKNMEIGDSFYKEGWVGKSGLYSIAKLYGMKIRTRKEKTGFRVWRVE